MQHSTMLDAMIDAHGLKGGTIHQFSRIHGVDLTKAQPPFYVRRLKSGSVDVLCKANEKNAVVFVQPSKGCRFGESIYTAMREMFK